MKKGTMIPIKKILGAGLLLIALLFTFAGVSSLAGKDVIIDGLFGWIVMLVIIVVCTLSAYFLIKSGKQQ